MLQQRYSKKKTISEGSKKITLKKSKCCLEKKFLSDLVIKTIEPIYYQKDFIKNSASTYFSKEMQVPISKGLKHLNTNVNSAVHYCAVLQAVVYCDMQ